MDHGPRDQGGARTVEGYQRHPQTEAEVGWADQSTVSMIGAETWEDAGSVESAVVARPATAADFDEWFALFEAVAAEGRWLGAETPLDRAARREFFDRCLAREGGETGDCDSATQSGDAAILVAEVDGTLAGAVSLHLTRGVVDLGMFVAAGRRGTGVGSALVEAAVSWARKVGAHKVALAVWPHNHPARALYEKFGFVTEGRRRRHHRRRSGELWDSVWMGLVLDTTSAGGPEG